MGLFELENNSCVGGVKTQSGSLKDECIIALKVYDSCRQQDCLDVDIIGPARAAQYTTYCGNTVEEGEIIKRCYCKQGAQSFQERLLGC